VIPQQVSFDPDLARYACWSDAIVAAGALALSREEI